MTLRTTDLVDRFSNPAARRRSSYARGYLDAWLHLAMLLGVIGFFAFYFYVGGAQ